MVSHTHQHLLPVCRLVKKTGNGHGTRHGTEMTKKFCFRSVAVTPGMNSTHRSVGSFIRPERWYATRAKSHTVEVTGASHAVYVSRLKEVAALWSKKPHSTLGRRTRNDPDGHRADQSREACNWLLPDRVQRNRGRAMMLVAGRMTATARADIGARCSSPTVKRGSEACLRTDVWWRSSALTTISIGSLPLIRALGIRPVLGGANGEKERVWGIAILHPDAAGIDVGASELFVAVSADRDHQPVHSFPTFTRDLNALADWLQQCGVCSVALKTFCYSR